MTPAPVLALCLANLVLIALLPRIFFRPGRLNAAWWATAAPFVLAGATVCAAAAGAIQGPVVAPLAATALGTAAALLAAASAALIGFTLGSHAQPVSLWHQPSDAPGSLVTRGAYARIRHPFYAAFLLSLCGCLAAVPHALTASALVLGVIQLSRTARREERRLIAAFGDAYLRYMARTGRFLPVLAPHARPRVGAGRGRVTSRATRRPSRSP